MLNSLTSFELTTVLLKLIKPQVLNIFSKCKLVMLKVGYQKVNDAKIEN